MSSFGYNTVNESYGKTQDPPAVIENWMGGPSLATNKYCGNGGWNAGKPPCTPCAPGDRYCNNCGMTRNGPWAGMYPARYIPI